MKHLVMIAIILMTGCSKTTVEPVQAKPTSLIGHWSYSSPKSTADFHIEEWADGYIGITRGTIALTLPTGQVDTYSIKRIGAIYDYKHALRFIVNDSGSSIVYADISSVEEFDKITINKLYTDGLYTIVNYYQYSGEVEIKRIP